MAVAPLCIIQARYNSHRLPGKMLLTLGGETLIARAWRIACEAFGQRNVVVAIPANDVDGPLGHALLAEIVGPTVFPWHGDESDVLGRFHACAHTYRWHPDSVIVRYTPDDPLKDVDSLRRVAAGERLPVEQGGEAFTLAMLDAAHERLRLRDGLPAGWPMGAREHITHALFPDSPPPPAPLGCWTIDTREDYEAAEAQMSAPLVLNEWREIKVAW